MNFEIGGFVIEIKLVKHSDQKEQLVNLHNLCFGRKTSEQLWDWKFIDNPLVSSQPEVIVAMENGRIVGARPFLLSEMWVDKSKIVAALHCETMVHPQFRNMGIFNQMGKYSIQYLKENNHAISYGFPGPSSRRGFLSQGYRVVAPIEMMFRPVNARILLSQGKKFKFIGNCLGFVYDKLLNPRIDYVNNEQSGFVIDVFDKYQEELKIMDSWEKQPRIDIVRSESNLKWRFDKHPENKYKYVLVKKKLVGYAVISMNTQLNGLRRGIIVDYLVKGDNSSCFLTLVKRSLTELVKSNCDIINMWCFNDPTFGIELIKHLGFKSSFKYPFNRIFNYEYMDALLIDEQLGKRMDIYNKNNWRITNALPDNT